MKTIEEYFNDYFTNRISNKELDKHSFYMANPRTEKSKKLLSSLIENGTKIKTGYVSTAVRGFHNYVILVIKE